MFVIAGALIGAITGGSVARKRRGSMADIAQYAAGFGICFALVGLIVTVILDRMI